MDKADTVWMLVSTALVLLMTPAIGLFYGGMVRPKNLIATMMKSFSAIALLTLLWVFFGYSLAFGPDHGSLIGSLDWFFLNGVGFEPHPYYAPTIPHSLYMLFQMKFAVITPVIIIGAFVERVRFSSFLYFIFLWSLLVYTPMAHWVWGQGGWLGELGALDFAGGAVIHMTSGIAALAVALSIRKRKNFQTIEDYSNLPMTLLGTVLLWFGWFGFNGGSALSAGPLAAHAILTTTVATSAAAFTWMMLSWKRGRPNLLGMAIGSVVGLVAITPACGFVSVPAAIIIGAVGSVVSFYCIRLRKRLKIDESLDVWACHGMAGTWGALATGLFATTVVNPDGANGLFYGDINQFWVQLLSVVVTWAFAFSVTWCLSKLLDKTLGLTVSEEEEELGLDISQHGEQAYFSGL